MTTATVDSEPRTSTERRLCGRCGAFLRSGHHGPLCDPCDRSAASEASERAASLPPTLDLVRLVAGLMLVHDALHPGTKLYLREALAELGVEADHITIMLAARKLRRRHGLQLSGESREPGYRVESWSRRVAHPVAHPVATDCNVDARAASTQAQMGEQLQLFYTR